MNQKTQSPQGQPSDTTNQIEQAYQVWRKRQDRTSHPEGRFDSQQRWYPASSEKCFCCTIIRQPSAAFPFSLLTHCRSAEHVANLCGVSASALRSRITKDRRAAQREGGKDYYKAMAMRDGCYYSIFDGETQYNIGETITDCARQGHGGGIYVYCTEQEARRAHVPDSSALLDAPRVILRVKAAGAYCRYDNGKLAFSRVTPLGLCG